MKKPTNTSTVIWSTVILSTSFLFNQKVRWTPLYLLPWKYIHMRFAILWRISIILYFCLKCHNAIQTQHSGIRKSLYNFPAKVGSLIILLPQFCKAPETTSPIIGMILVCFLLASSKEFLETVVKAGSILKTNNSTITHNKTRYILFLVTGIHLPYNAYILIICILYNNSRGLF